MGETKLRRMPFEDPISGEKLYVSEVACEESGVSIRGRFEVPRWARLSAENEQFLETFLRCKGMINSVEKELGISYPTVKGRLDNLLAALDLAPVKEDTAKKDKSSGKRAKILDQLEKGEITAEEAKAKLMGGSK